MAKKVLIIEDDKFLRKVLVRKISAEGYQIVEATDGEKGLKSVEEEKPDLVLLDLVLPEMNGFEVLAKIKKNPNHMISKIPVIVLSNLGEEKDIKKGLELGADDYLIKAYFTPGEILKKIENVLKK